MVFATRARVRRQERVGGHLRSYLGLVVIKRVRSRQDIEGGRSVMGKEGRGNWGEDESLS